MAFRAKRQWESCILDCSEALRLSPEFSDALVVRGLACAEIGQLQAALRDLTDAIRLDPMNESALEIRAGVYAQLNEHEKADQDTMAAKGLRANRDAKQLNAERSSHAADVVPR